MRKGLEWQIPYRRIVYTDCPLFKLYHYPLPDFFAEDKRIALVPALCRSEFGTSGDLPRGALPVCGEWAGAERVLSAVRWSGRLGGNERATDIGEPRADDEHMVCAHRRLSARFCRDLSRSRHLTTPRLTGISLPQVGISTCLFPHPIQ